MCWDDGSWRVQQGSTYHILIYLILQTIITQLLSSWNFKLLKDGHWISSAVGFCGCDEACWPVGGQSNWNQATQLFHMSYHLQSN